MGRQAAALDDLECANQIHPNNFHVQLLQATCFRGLDDFGVATDLATAALANVRAPNVAPTPTIYRPTAPASPVSNPNYPIS